MISFYDGSDCPRSSIGWSTYFELCLIRDSAVLAQGVGQSPPVGEVGNVAGEMGILLAKFIPGTDDAGSGVDEGTTRNDINNGRFGADSHYPSRSKRICTEIVKPGQKMKEVFRTAPTRTLVSCSMIGGWI